MKEIINFLRLLWELPQNLLGFILFQVYSLDCMCMEVTYGDVRATFQGGRYANGQFRGGSSESYDSQADYDGRNTESLGYGRSTICQAVGTYQNEE